MQQAPSLLIVVAGALLDGENRVLLGQRPAGKHLAGLWEFPGGKIEPGETPEQALIREIWEEIGVCVEHSALYPISFVSHPYAQFHLLMPLYLIRSYSGAVCAREGQQLQWVEVKKLGDYPMPPADRPLVEMLRKFLLTENGGG